MTVTFSNGTALDCEGVQGETAYFQGATRECLVFLFDAGKHTLAELDSQFTAENCASVTVTNDDLSFVHDGYAIRVSLMKSEAGDVTAEEQRGLITVKMAQMTYLEQTQRDLADAVDDLILSSLEG